MTEMLYPVVMPAIRKAIAAYFEQLLQRINLVIQQRFSAQSLKWRIESWRTGIPFAEIVLAKTLEYRVENIFLIDRSSGLLLLHVGDDPQIGEDADLISGMLTAIRDFVHDSFDLESNEGLDAMKVGDLNVWIEQSPQVVLAAVIRGTPPVEYRVVLQQILEASSHRVPPPHWPIRRRPETFRGHPPPARTGPAHPVQRPHVRQ